MPTAYQDDKLAHHGAKIPSRLVADPPQTPIPLKHLQMVVTTVYQSGHADVEFVLHGTLYGLAGTD
jgi:hypothetical protein